MSSYYGRGVQGATGPAGRAATIAVGTVTTGAPTDPASVVNSGDGSQAVFDFVIPQGIQGIQGAEGDAATVDVDPNTVTAPAGDPAAVINTGDSHAAVFKFTIPQGAKGDPGDAANISVGTVTTVPPQGGSLGQATVVASGTPQARVLDFGIPAGLKGDTGAQGNPGFPGALSGAGAPTSAIGDVVGQIYLNTTTGEVYKLMSLSPVTWTLLVPAIDTTPATGSSHLITSGAVAAADAALSAAIERAMAYHPGDTIDILKWSPMGAGFVHYDGAIVWTVPLAKPVGSDVTSIRIRKKYGSPLTDAVGINFTCQGNAGDSTVPADYLYTGNQTIWANGNSLVVSVGAIYVPSSIQAQVWMPCEPRVANNDIQVIFA